MRIYHIHIRKTAGTAVLSLLKSAFEKEQVCPIRSEIELNAKIQMEDRLKYIQQYSLVTGHFYNQGQNLKRTHNFVVFVRQPISRTVSSYNQIISDENDIFRRFILNKHMSEALLTPECAREFRNGQTRQLVRNAGEEYDKLTPEKRIAIATDFLQSSWFLGVQDIFELSYNLLSKKIGKEFVKNEAPKINTEITAKGKKSKDLDSNILRILYEINKEDLVLFENALKIFDHRVRDFIIKMF